MDDSEDSDDEQESVDTLGETAVNDVATAAALLLLLVDFVLLSCEVATFFRRAPWRFWPTSSEGWVLLLLVLMGVIGRGISFETVRERVRKATGEGVEFCCLPVSRVLLRSESPCLRFLLLLLPLRSAVDVSKSCKAFLVLRLLLLLFLLLLAALAAF